LQGAWPFPLRALGGTGAICGALARGRLPHRWDRDAEAAGERSVDRRAYSPNLICAIEFDASPPVAAGALDSAFQSLKVSE